MLTSLNNRRLAPATCVSARTPVTRLTLSRQNSLRAQSTIVGARLALRQVSSHVVASLSPASPASGKPQDVPVAPLSAKTESEASSARHDDVTDDSDDVRQSIFRRLKPTTARVTCLAVRLSLSSIWAYSKINVQNISLCTC